MWLSQPPLGLWWIGPLAVTPWLSTISRGGILTGAVSGLLFGTLSGGLVASWVYEGVRSIGGSHAAAFGGLTLVALFSAGLAWAVFGMVAALASRWSAGWWVGSCTVAAVVVDALRSAGVLGVPWSLLGHSQFEVTGVAQLAVLGGVPVISGLLMAIGASMAVAFRRPVQAPCRVLVACSAAAYVGLALFGAKVAESSWPHGPSAERFDLLAIQPNVPAGDRWEPLAQGNTLDSAIALTEAEIGSASPDLVVWPETMLTTPLEEAPGLRAHLQRAIDTFGVPIVLGAVGMSRSADPSLYRNSALRVAPVAGTIASVDKTHAIPVAEAGGGLWSAPAILDLAGLSGVTRRVELGREQKPLEGSPELALVFCYEVVFPHLVRQRRTSESVAIVQIANDTWFASESVSRQLLAYGSFRAIEQRLPLLRVAQGGGSALVDPLGRVVETLPFDATGSILAEVGARPTPSLEERAALALLGVGSGIAPLLAAAAWRVAS